MLKKSFIIIVMMLLIIGICGNVKAAELEKSLSVVEAESETKQLENNQGNIKSKVISYDSKTGTMKVELSVNNTKTAYENTEIIIIVDENLANNPTKLNEYITKVSSLANTVFKLNIKIGIIGMKGTISDIQESVPGPSDQGEVDGSASDAEVLINASNDTQAITAALQNMNSEKVTYNSNLQAALKLAKSSFSNNVNKMLISTYNGMPSIAIGVCKDVTYGEGTKYETEQQAQEAKNNNIISKTKTELLSLRNSDIQFILLELENSDSAQAKNIYGTSSNPTYGKIYNLTSGGLPATLLKMYSEFTKLKDTNITSVIAKAYFPKDIMDNYHITIEENSQNVDISKLETDGYIIWNIDTLQAGETATIQYTLQINNMNDETLLDKVSTINEKVELTYKDVQEQEYTVTLTSSPKIQLVNKQEEQNEGNGSDESKQEDDGTKAPGEIPQTGTNIILVLSSIGVIIAVVAIMYKKYSEYKDI